MNKLELRHIQHYPIGMRGIHVMLEGYETRIDSMSESMLIIGMSRFPFLQDVMIQEVKPILRPLSDLVKPCLEGGLIPIIELLKLKYPDRPTEGRYSEIEVSSSGYPSAWYCYSAPHSITVREPDLDNTAFWIIEKLFEWHFDVFGLREQNLCIYYDELNK